MFSLEEATRLVLITDKEKNDEGLNIFNNLSDVDKVCEEALSLIADVNDIFSLPLSEKPHPNEHYRIPHKEPSNISFSSNSSSYDSSDDEIKYDFKLKSLTNDPDYSPQEIYSDEEESVVKKKGGRHGKCRDAGKS